MREKVGKPIHRIVCLIVVFVADPGVIGIGTETVYGNNTDDN